MNQFVNPKKRSISLPGGCKDLADVLKHSERSNKSPIKRFITLVLMQAQQDCATELIIGSAHANGDTPIRYKVEGSWHDLTPFPSHIRSRVVSELGRMAGLPSGQFPQDGVLAMSLEETQLLWRVRIASPDAECILTSRDV